MGPTASSEIFTWGIFLPTCACSFPPRRTKAFQRDLRSPTRPMPRSASLHAPSLRCSSRPSAPPWRRRCVHPR